MDFQQNFNTVLNGHTGVPTGGGDDGVQKLPYKAKTSFDDTADVKDILSDLASSDILKLNKSDLTANFSKLSELVGRPMAIKLMNSVYAFSQRSDTEGLSQQARIENYFKLGDTDKDVDNILKVAKSFNYNANQSSSVGVQKATRRLSDEPNASSKDMSKIKDVAKQITQ